MFSFLKKLLGEKPNKKAVAPKKPDNIGVSFGGGPGKDNVNRYWGEVWQKVLIVDDRYQNIEKGRLLEIEATIREDVTNGIGAQKTATKLRSLFESIGLKRKDALKMAADAGNFVYQTMNENITIGNGMKFITTTKDENGNIKEVSETPDEFIKNARMEYKQHKSK